MFDKSFDRVIGHEGGFQADPKDRGNWTSGICGSGELKGTKWGLSAMTYPHLDIQRLTIDDARAIYYEDWWCENHLDIYPPAMQYQMFDAMINHGVRNASKILQRAAGVKADGYVGPLTLDSINRCDPLTLVVNFNRERLLFYVEIGTFHEYGRGWCRRVAENIKYAMEDSQ